MEKLTPEDSKHGLYDQMRCFENKINELVGHANNTDKNLCSLNFPKGIPNMTATAACMLDDAERTNAFLREKIKEQETRIEQLKLLNESLGKLAFEKTEGFL